MSVIHSFKEFDLNSAGLWIMSVDGQEIMLEPRQAMQLGEAIAKQQRGSGSATPARRSALAVTHRSAAPVMQRSTTQQVTGTLQFTGESSFTDPQWIDHAKRIAKQRATKALNSYLQRLANEGKTFGTGRSTGQHIVNGNSVKYVITATLGD